MSMKKQDVRDLIESELDAMRDKKDEEFEPSEQKRFTVPEERMSEEEAIIDELLLSVPRSQGYYLKLMKELRPNDFEFKLRIDNFENWSDLEYEISNLVRSYTLKQPSKWGSGHYRVIIWRDGGLRGPKHKPIDFYVDAMEQELPGTGNQQVPNRDLESQLSSMSGLIESVKRIMPQQEQLSPVDVQKMVNEAYLNGLQNADKKSNESSATIAAMMTGVFSLIGTIMSNQNKPIDLPRPVDPMESLAKLTEVMSNLGLSNKDKKEKTLVENLTELKLLGLWKEPKDEDPLAKLGELRNVFDMISDLGGLSKGERPSTMEKIIDVIGPRVPEMIANVTSTINNAIDYSKVRIGLPQTTPVRQIVKSAPEALPTVNKPNGDSNMSEQPIDTQVAMKVLFDELYVIIASNDYSKFDHIANRLSVLMGTQVLTDISTDRLPESMIANILTMYGDDRYRDQIFQPQLNSYLKEFVVHVKSKFAPPHIVATCNVCQAEYEFQSDTDFESDSKTCDTPNCTGILVKANVNGNGAGNIIEPIASTVKSPEPHMMADMNPYSTH